MTRFSVADTLTIREYQEGDLGEVLEVLRAALGENPLLRRTPELFSWKHIRNPFGQSIILGRRARANRRRAGVHAVGTQHRCRRHDPVRSGR